MYNVNVYVVYWDEVERKTSMWLPLYAVSLPLFKLTKACIKILESTYLIDAWTIVYCETVKQYK